MFPNDEHIIVKELEIENYSKLKIKPAYYSSIAEYLFYVYSEKKRLCHISLPFGNYCYMNDCIDGARWNKDIRYTSIADLRKQIIVAAAEAEQIVITL